MRYLQLLFIVFITHFAGAQSYRFEQTSDNYSNLSGATVINNPGFGSGNLYFISLPGDTFRFYKHDYKFDSVKTRLLMQTNGGISIINDSTSITIDAAFTLLDSIDNNSELSYKIEGTSGNKIVKMQWKNLRIRNGAFDNYIHMQCWLHQATGIIELHYGPSSASNATGFSETGPSSGPQVGIFYASNISGVMYEKLWLNGHPTSLTFDSSTQFVFRPLKGVPPQGTIYSFIPKTAAQSVNEIAGGVILPVYPNPATTNILLPFETTGFISDAAGRAVLNFENTSSPDISGLTSGVYIIRTNGGAVARFIKE